MRKILLLIALAVSICSAARLNAQNMEYQNMFPRGEEFKSLCFTGKLWLKLHPRDVGMGKDKATLLAAVTHLISYIGYPRVLNVLACLNEVLPKK